MKKKKIEEDDFFDESEIRKAGRHVEEMDTSFVGPEKHHFFAWFFVFLLIIVIGGACAYYFVLNTPQKTYLTLVDKFTKKNPIVSNNKNINYSYSISTNILSNDKDTQKLLDIINKVELSGTTKYDNDIIKGNNNIKYNNGELLDITYMLNTSNSTLYLKLNNVLDKVIKMEASNEQDTLSKNIDTNKDDYIKIYNAIIKNFKLSLENANYERKITKLNNSFVFKETLLLDETLEKELLTKLIHDDDFLQNYAKVTNSTVSDISDELNEELANPDTEVSTISIYKTIIKNEILKIELIDEDSNITINKENNKYNFEIVDENELTYKGYLKLDKKNNETKLVLNLELIKEKLSIELNTTYSKDSKDIVELDSKNATNYEELTEEDITKITKYIEENKTIKSLLDDLGLTEKMNEITSM